LRQVKPLGGEAYLMVDGLRFDLLQFHFHSSSEHTLNGKSYPLEVHFVHANTQTPGVTKLAVWGILFPSTK
jgi:carbonic anhydrase